MNEAKRFFLNAKYGKNGSVSPSITLACDSGSLAPNIKGRRQSKHEICNALPEAKKMAKQQKIAEEESKEESKEEKKYKNPVLFLRKSKAGEHLYAFNRDEALGGEIESLIFNVSDVKKLLDGKMEWIKVSVMEVKEEG